MPAGTYIPLTPGTLPQNFCPSVWQDVLNGFTRVLSLDRSKITGSVPNATVMVVSQNKPADTTALWKQIDSQGRFIRLYAYAQGQWLSPHPLPPGATAWWFNALPNFSVFDGGDSGVPGDQSGPMWQAALYAAAIQVTTFYAVPGAASAVTVNVTTESPFLAGQKVIINSGTYDVSALLSGQLNLTYDSGNATDSTVPAQTPVYTATENLVYDKFNQQVVTTAQFTVPALNASVTVQVSYEVSATSTPFAVGQLVLIGRGQYSVTGIATNQLTLTYKGPLVRSGTPVLDISGNPVYGDVPIKATLLISAGTLPSSGTVIPLGATGGEETHHLTGTEAGVYPGHRHGLGQFASDYHQGAFETGGALTAGLPGEAAGGSGDVAPRTLTDTGTAFTGGHFVQTDIPTFLPNFAPHNNLPPYVVAWLVQRTDRLFYAVS